MTARKRKPRRYVTTAEKQRRDKLKTYWEGYRVRRSNDLARRCAQIREGKA
jgi:hypothetical protein